MTTVNKLLIYKKLDVFLKVTTKLALHVEMCSLLGTTPESQQIMILRAI